MTTHGWSWMRQDGELSSSPSKSSVASDSDASLVDLQQDYELLLLGDEATSSTTSTSSSTATPSTPAKKSAEKRLQEFLETPIKAHEVEQEKVIAAEEDEAASAKTCATATAAAKKQDKRVQQGIADFRELVEQKLKKELPPAKTKVVEEQRQAFFSKFFGRMFGAGETSADKQKYKVNKEVDVTPVLEKLAQAHEEKSVSVITKGKKKMEQKKGQLKDIKDELITFIQENADKLIAQLQEATKNADGKTKQQVAIICAQIKDVSNRAIEWIKGHFVLMRGKVIEGFVAYFNFMDKLAAQCYALAAGSCGSRGANCGKRVRAFAVAGVDKMKMARVTVKKAEEGQEADENAETKEENSGSEEEKNYVKLEKEEPCMKGAEAAEFTVAAGVRKAAKDIKKRARRACTQRQKASKKTARALRKCLLRAKHKTIGNLTKFRIALTRTVFRHSGILDEEDKRVFEIADDMKNSNGRATDFRKTIQESLKKTSSKTTAFVNSLKQKTSFADAVSGTAEENSSDPLPSATNTSVFQKLADFFAGCSGGAAASASSITLFGNLGCCTTNCKNKGPLHAVALLVVLLALQSRLLLLSVLVDAPDDSDSYGYFGLGLMGEPDAGTFHHGICPLKKRNLLSLLSGKDDDSALGGKGSWFTPSDLSSFRAALFGTQQCPVEKLLWAHSRPEPSCYSSYNQSAQPQLRKHTEKPYARLHAKKRGSKFMLKPGGSGSSAFTAFEQEDKSVFSIMRDYVKSKFAFSNSSFSAEYAANVYHNTTNVAKIEKSAERVKEEYETEVLNLFQKLMKEHEEEQAVFGTSRLAQQISENENVFARNNYRRGHYGVRAMRGYFGGPKVRKAAQYPRRNKQSNRSSAALGAFHVVGSSSSLQQKNRNKKMAEEEKIMSEREASPAVMFPAMATPTYGPAKDMHNAKIQLAKSLVLYQNPSLSVRDFSAHGTCGYGNSDVAKRFRKAEQINAARRMKAAEERKILSDRRVPRAPRRTMTRRARKHVDVFCSAQGYCGYGEQLTAMYKKASKKTTTPQPSAATEHSYHPLVNVPFPAPVPRPDFTEQPPQFYRVPRYSQTWTPSAVTTTTTHAAVIVFPKRRGGRSSLEIPSPFSVEYRQQLQVASSRSVYIPSRGRTFGLENLSSSRRRRHPVSTTTTTSIVRKVQRKLEIAEKAAISSIRNMSKISADANFTALLKNYSRLAPKTSTSLVPNMSLSIAPATMFRNATDMIATATSSSCGASRATTKLALTTAGPGLSTTFFTTFTTTSTTTRMMCYGNQHNKNLRRVFNGPEDAEFLRQVSMIQNQVMNVGAPHAQHQYYQRQGTNPHGISNPISKKSYRRFIFPSSVLGGENSSSGDVCPSYEGPLYLDSQMPGSENVPVRNITAAREAYMKVIGLEN